MSFCFSSSSRAQVHISIICIGLASVSTIIFSQDYSLELNNYCDLVFNESRLRNLDVNDDFKKACTKFSSTSEGNETDKEIYSNIIQIDWLISMSAHNVKNYYDVFKYNTTQENKEDKIVEITLDYSFMYFLTGLTILIADYFFILNLNLLDEDLSIFDLRYKANKSGKVLDRLFLKDSNVVILYVFLYFFQ